MMDKPRLASWNTVLTGVYAFALWSLFWRGNWLAASLDVLLIYVHELGHVLGATCRRVGVELAPFFTLDGGGFTILRYAPRKVEDTALALLAGPIVGGAAALIVVLGGDALHIATLTAAGLVAILVNWANLIPLRWKTGNQRRSSDGAFVLSKARRSTSPLHPIRRRRLRRNLWRTQPRRMAGWDAIL